MMAPKCTSWRGHKFEARYSEALPGALESDRISIGAILALKNKTYECDICVRCGHVILKDKANG